MPDSPAILVHSGDERENEVVVARIAEARPGLRLLTANGEDEVRERLPGAEVLFAWEFPMQLLPLASRLRWFQVMGAGLERLAGAGVPEGIVVTNMKGIFGTAMAEYALAYMLAHTQSIPRILRQQQERNWEQFEPALLAGRTAGVIGLGSIGREIARRCTAFGMRVIGVNRSGEPVADVDRTYAAADIDWFLPECDFLISVVPQTSESTGLLNAERLALLKPSCYYVNIGRGNIVDLDALNAALESGRLAGAALDVFPTEPLPPEHPIWATPNLTVTPHISGVNRPEDVTGVFLNNLSRYMAGEPLINVVDLSRGY
ncbi:MAG TPA: D-2-hydroxyacid dehydrogenase [Thermomicrobiales bacterium]|nr:D-2-hydroxyacid dehydrogenase [Thermomicrobiales bacterium]